jgi:uncharacterized protein involved in exopolysaccharide biosynthesis
MAEPRDNQHSFPGEGPIIGYFVPAPAHPARDDVTLGEVVRRVWRGRWLTIALALGLAVASFLFATYSTRVYGAVVVLSLIRPDGTELTSGLGSQLGRLAAVAGVQIGGASAGGSREEFFAYLKSRQLQGKFVEAENLMPLLFADRWDAKAGRWKADDGPVPSLDEGVERLRRHLLFITQDKLTGLVAVTFEWKDRELVARWANSYVRMANAEVRAHAASDADRSLEFLTKEVDKTQNIPVQQAIYGLIQSQLNSRMLASVREEFAYKIIDPAVVPDARRYVRPRRLIYAIVGCFLGGLIGAGIAVFRSRPHPTGPAPTIA